MWQTPKVCPLPDPQWWIDHMAKTAGRHNLRPGDLRMRAYQRKCPTCGAVAYNYCWNRGSILPTFHDERYIAAGFQPLKGLDAKIFAHDRGD